MMRNHIYFLKSVFILGTVLATPVVGGEIKVNLDVDISFISDKFCTDQGNQQNSENMERADSYRMTCINRSDVQNCNDRARNEVVNRGLNTDFYEAGEIQGEKLKILKTLESCLANLPLNSAADTAPPEAQQAINMCDTYYNQAMVACGPEKQSSVDSSLSDVVQVMAGVKAGIKGVCDTTVQSLTAARSIYGTFSNSCAEPAQNCLNSCFPLINQPGDGSAKYKTCTGFQTKIQQYNTDIASMGGSLANAAQCAANNSANYNFASLNCTGAAAGTPECVCKASSTVPAQQQVCLMQYLASKGTSTPGVSKATSPTTAAMASTAAPSGYQYSEPPEDVLGVAPSNRGHSADGKLQGGTIGSANGSGGLGNGSGGGESSGGSSSGEPGGVVLNKGTLQGGVVSNSGGWKSGNLYSASNFKNNSGKGPIAALDGQRKFDPSKYYPNLSARSPSGAQGGGSLVNGDGIQESNNKIFKVMQKGYQNSDRNDYLLNK